MTAHSYLSPTGIEVAFVLIGLLVLASGVLVVTVQNLVHAALWLVVCLGGIAGEYLLLGAELIAWVQVLIYVGAVVVLLLFGLVLTKAPIGPTTELDARYRLPGLIVAGAAAGVLVTVLFDAYRSTWIDPAADVAQGSAKSAGTALFKFWVLPFETLSVLLLAALVGAIVLSRRDRAAGSDDEDEDLPDRTAADGPVPGAGAAQAATPEPGAPDAASRPVTPGQRTAKTEAGV